MKALSDIQQTAIQEQIVKRLCFNCLPLLLSLLLLCWLSFGLPHPTWMLLLKTIVQANTLIAMEGMAFLLPLAILAVQSIFLLSSWGLLIWGGTREAKAVLALYRDLATGVATPLASAAGAPQTATAAPTIPAYFSTPPSIPPPSISQNPFAQNPFDSDDENDFPTDIIPDMSTQFTTPSDEDEMPMLRVPPLPYERDRYQRMPLEPVNSSPQMFDELAEQTIRRPPTRKDTRPFEEVERSLEVKHALDEKVQDDHDEIDQPQKRPSTSIQKRLGVTAPKLPAAKPQEKQSTTAHRPSPAQNDPFGVIEDDPFAVKEDVLNVFEEEHIQEKEEQTSPDKDPVFVFGNPFEGPLPDVFMEDEDLKRSILQQQGELSDDTSPHKAVKKEGQKPTGIRKRSV